MVRDRFNSVSSVGIHRRYLTSRLYNLIFDIDLPPNLVKTISVPLFFLIAALSLGITTTWGQSVLIPGDNSFVNCGDLDVAGNQITVEAIVTVNALGNNIVSKHTGPPNANYLLRTTGAEMTTTNGFISVPSNHTPNIGECYHLAYTYDGANVRYFVNGCMSNIAPHTGNLLVNDLAMAIGNQSGCQCEPWNGFIDEVRVWNVARTEQQIRDNMFDLPNPAAQAGLLAYYKFDGNYINVQGNPAWNGVPVGNASLQANPACQNADLTFASSAVVTDVSCPGGSNGSVQMTSTGGFPSYWYSLNGAAFTQVNPVTGLPAGAANIVARSGIGECLQIVPVTVSQPDGFNTLLTGVPPSCSGGTNGSAALMVAGGTTPYTFLWSNSSTAQNPTNLPDGASTVTITDANGCTTTDALTLTAPDPVTTSAFATFVSNSGACDATGTANPQGGVAPYTYSWSNGGAGQVNPALCEGPNTVTVTDANGCSATQTLNVSIPACLTDVDFNEWQQAGAPGNGNWNILGGGAQVRQTVNGDPTFFVTPVEYINVRMKGKMRTTDGDDDHIGVVFGLKQPVGNTTNYDMWLFDWKQRDQNNNGFMGFEGFCLSRVLGNIPNNGPALWPTFWGRTQTPEFTPIMTDYGPGKGYVRNQTHDIEVLYTTTRVVVIVDNDTIFEHFDCFEPGRFGFYNYSQPQVTYSDFTYELFISFEAESPRVCLGDDANFIFYEPCGTSSNLDQFDEMQWDFGDGTTLINDNITVDNVNPSHQYQAPGNYTVRLIALDNLGCRDTVFRDVQVLPLPQPDYTAINTCHTEQTELTDATVTGGSPITQWQWAFGDGGSANTQNAAHTYTLPGIYDVTLSVTDQDGCNGNATIPLEIFALPDVGIGAVSVCDGEAMELIDASIDQSSIVSTAWNLGDGSTANTALVSHTYAGPGSYNVTLSVVSGAGCTGQTTQQVMVFPNPVADFNFTEVCAGTPTPLTDASSVAAPSVLSEWLWDIGNNGIIDYQTQNPQHTFGLGGNYNVTLTAISDFGCETSVTLPVTASFIPVATISATSVCVGENTAFSDLSTVAVGSITGWDWDFGDGNGSAQQSPEHAYAAPGAYTVTLTVTSNNNCADATTFNANVRQLPVPDFADIEQCFVSALPFADQSTIGDGVLAGWEWDFGDGGSSTQQNPIHTYPDFGDYDVRLTVTSAVGCVDSITKTITLYDNPTAGFEAEIGCQGELVQLTDTSTTGSGIITQWAWTFPAGGNSDIQNPQHAFGTAGNVNVTLAVTSDLGCTGSTTAPVTIHPKPQAAFSAPDVCLNDTTVITNLSTVASGSIVLNEFDLGDGTTTDTLTNILYIYGSAGVYDIILMTESDEGCRDTVALATEVHHLPVAQFVAEDVCLIEDATFTDQSTTQSGTLNSWSWNLGDGTQVNGQGPHTHQYVDPDDYAVTLIVLTDVGCTDTISDTINVNPMPVADFTADSVCSGIPSAFTNLSNISAGSIVSNTWLFGGGQGSEQAEPSFAFPNTGYTDVTLTVVSDQGCSDDTVKAIRVYVLPEPQFVAFDTCAGKEITFTNLSEISEGAISTYSWEMGDGSSYTATNPNHTYNDHAFYTVRLVATSNFGCVDSTSQVIEVYPLPEPGFTAMTTEGCVPLPVEFYNTSAIASGYTIAGHEWDFGNGSSALTSNPSLIYTDEGDYDVLLVVTSAKGCVDSLRISPAVTAWPKPTAGFMTDTLRYHMRFPRPRITDESQGATEWWYSMGDGTVYEEQEPEHTYEEHGNYLITQIVSNDFGCADTAGLRIIVDPNISVYIPNTFTPDDDGLNDVFFIDGEGIDNLELWIYNRWGQLLFQTIDKDEPWDGRVNGNVVPNGVYLYKAIVQDITNRTKVYSGEVRVLR
jgi:gliding motility-associated-like protein